MFSNLSKAIQASRDAIGTIQTTLKDQNVLDPLTARLRPSTPQQSSYQIDEDGFSDQTLVAPNTSETGDLIRFSSDRGTRQPATDNVQVKSDAPVPPTDTAVFAPSTQQALSSMTPEQVFAMDPAEMTERLARLRRFESKFAGKHMGVPDFQSPCRISIDTYFVRTRSGKSIQRLTAENTADRIYNIRT